MMLWILAFALVPFVPLQGDDPPATASEGTSSETVAPAEENPVATRLGALYQEHLERYEAILTVLEAGGSPTPEAIRDLVDDAPQKWRLEIDFENYFLAELRRKVLNRERLRKEKESADAPTSEGPVEAQAKDVAAPGLEEMPGKKEIGEVTLSEDRILGSLYPEALGDLLFSLEQYRQATLAYRVVPQLDDAVAERILYRIAQCLARSRDIDAARDAFQQVLDRFPEGAWSDHCRLHLEILLLEEEVRASLVALAKGPAPKDEGSVR